MSCFPPLQRCLLRHAIFNLAMLTLCATATALEQSPAPSAAPNAPTPAAITAATKTAPATALTAAAPAKSEAAASKADSKTDPKAAPNASKEAAAITSKSAVPADPPDSLRNKLNARQSDLKAPTGIRIISKNNSTATPLSRPADLRKDAVARNTEAAHSVDWSYEGGSGPEEWGRLNPEFAKCSSGTRQSPIDIRDGIKVNLDEIMFNYRPVSFRVIDNGHTVQVNVGQGNSMEVMGRRYELVQFHFHRPSEERINGKQFDMVAHLVHKDSQGRLAYVAVLLERGAAHPAVQSVWNNLPLEKGEEMPAKTLLDMRALLPAERSYYTYMGSLTTPPCSEGVVWVVLKNPLPVSDEQIGIFTHFYPMNARPVQSASGRLIKESN